jgi:hypothetical protein
MLDVGFSSGYTFSLSAVYIKPDNFIASFGIADSKWETYVAQTTMPIIAD